MQNYGQCPIFCDVARPYAYPVLNSGLTLSTDLTISAANGGVKGFITLKPQSFFVFCGWVCQTNYDSAGLVMSYNGVSAVLSQPASPNTFLVEIQRGNANNYANVQLCQAEIGSSGQLSGKQNPLPTIYGPEQTLAFQFTDLTGLNLLTDAGAAVPLTIRFGMTGYIVKQEKWQKFLEYFPGLRAIYPR